MKITFWTHDLKLKHPFSISRHTYHSQPNIILCLQYQGFNGFGEATINPYYGIDISNLRNMFGQIGERLQHYHFSTPDQLFNDFSDLLDKNSFALAALNNASWDLYGRMLGEPVNSLLHLKTGEKPLTSYTLGIDSKEIMLEKMQELKWPVYKIKLGTPDDIGLIEYLRKFNDAPIRVDANCAWNAEETIEKSHRLKSLGVEFIEQPLARDDPDQEKCYKQSALPLIADESCRFASDVAKCAGNFHGVNIKLLKCGGISPAINMIKEARKLGLKIMIGCMTESTVGISAAAQLLSFVDYADLDGPLLLAEDLAEGIKYQDGYIYHSNGPGLGIIMKK